MSSSSFLTSKFSLRLFFTWWRQSKVILITVLLLPVLVLKSTLLWFRVFLPEEALHNDVPEFTEATGPKNMPPGMHRPLNIFS